MATVSAGNVSGAPARKVPGAAGIERAVASYEPIARVVVHARAREIRLHKSDAGHLPPLDRLVNRRDRRFLELEGTGLHTLGPKRQSNQRENEQRGRHDIERLLSG